MSVFVEARLLELGLERGDVLAGHDGHGLVGIPTRIARECGFGVVWVPGGEGRPTDDAHAEVVCNKTESLRRRLRAGSEILWWPS